MVKTNYIIACWSGKRRLQNPRYNSNPAYYLTQHLNALKEIDTSALSQITLVINENNPEPPLFTQAITAVPTEINNVPVHILRRPNIGMSYGAWVHAFQTFPPPKFKYAIVMEDDYMPSHSNMIQELITEIKRETSPPTAYVCSYFKKTVPCHPAHAAISNGIINLSLLQEKNLLTLPYSDSKSNDYGSNEEKGQVGQSQAMINANLKVRDYIDRFSSPFMQANGQIVIYGDPQFPSLIKPVV